MGLEFVVGSDAYSKLDRIIERLSDVNASIPRDSHEVVLATAKGAAMEAGTKVLSEPAFGDKHTGLREEVKEGLTVEDIPDGARITTSMPQRDEAIIPRGLDGFGGWRHPLFGDKSRWYRQRGAFSWFMDTMGSQHDGLERKLSDVLQKAARYVAEK